MKQIKILRINLEKLLLIFIIISKTKLTKNNMLKLIVLENNFKILNIKLNILNNFLN